jgi:hypothetical protein
MIFSFRNSYVLLPSEYGRSRTNKRDARFAQNVAHQDRPPFNPFNPVTRG